MNNVESSGTGDLSVECGDSITIRLGQSGGTGYVWSLVELGEGLVIEEERTVAQPQAAPGARGEYLLRLRADRVGQWPVELRLARSWENQSAENRRFSVTVR